MDEKFSAFLDNEATRDEADAVVNGLLRDDDLRVSWTRQYWIREALRSSAGDPDVTLDSNFSSRVMQAVQADAAPADTPAVPRQAKVVPMARPTHRRRWRSMAGFAVAASAAGLALFAAQPLTRLSDSVQSTTEPAASVQSGGAGGATIASTGMSDTPQMNRAQTLAGGMVHNVAGNQDYDQDEATLWQVSDPALANRLNGFLVEHNGLARGYGLGATTPGFVRVATSYGQVSAR